MTVPTDKNNLTSAERDLRLSLYVDGARPEAVLREDGKMPDHPRRQVHLSPAMMRKARRDFPPGGSADGRPPLSDFLEGPCKNASERFASDFEAQTEVRDGVRATLPDVSSSFLPMVFYAALTATGDIGILDYEVDETYPETIANDPSD